MRAFVVILTSVLAASCGGVLFGAPSPDGAVRAGAVRDSAMLDSAEIASAAIGLASATGFLNALASSSPGRTIARGGPSETGVPDETAPASRPSRMLVAVNAMAGPPDEQREVILVAAAQSDERWAIPVENPRITSRFGPRIDPINGQRGRMHRGTDFGAASGTAVYATGSGDVVLGGWCDNGTGNCVVIDHAAGWRSQYFHLSHVDVRPGQTIEQGDKIGEIGSTGRSTGPHLHFQVGRDGAAVDAEELFGERIE